MSFPFCESIGWKQQEGVGIGSEEMLWMNLINEIESKTDWEEKTKMDGSIQKKLGENKGEKKGNKKSKVKLNVSMKMNYLYLYEDYEITKHNIPQVLWTLFYLSILFV